MEGVLSWKRNASGEEESLGRKKGAETKKGLVLEGSRGVCFQLLTFVPTDFELNVQLGFSQAVD